MLLELTIRNFAIIEHINISWGPNLNVLTGETGAGKSIIVDAVGALLGDRIGSEAIRAGHERAFVEGIFVLPEDPDASGPLLDLLASHELAEEDGQLILSREMTRNGRTIARLNGRAVAISLLQQVGEHLVDVHGQSQHLSLLRTREHLDLLDRFAGLLPARRSLAKLVEGWRGLQARRRQLQEEIRLVSRERDLLRHEVAEIEATDLQPGEEEELVSLRQRLRYSERLRAAAEQSLLALHGTDEQRGAVDLLAQAASLCADGTRADSGMATLTEVLERLTGEAEEVSRDLRQYLDRFESEPRQVEDIEARFLAVADLKRKYGDSVEAVLAYLEQARGRLATAESGESLLVDLDHEEGELRSELARLAYDLSGRRLQAVGALTNAIQRQLEDLNLAGARFEIHIQQHPDANGIPWPGSAIDAEPKVVAIDTTGADKAEFLFSANPGEPPRALGRIASGGELARVALALKAALAEVDQRPILIFDEIDVGVGGRGASVVGQKLWELTRKHQVLCVTHMPQVAAYADHHLVVCKQTRCGAAETVVDELTAAGKVDELAAMLGGNSGSSAAQANARELLAQSDLWKKVQSGARKAG